MKLFAAPSLQSKIIFGCMALAAVTFCVGILSNRVQNKLSRNAIEIYDQSFQSMNYLRLAQTIVLGMSRDLALGENDDAVYVDQLESAEDALKVAEGRAMSDTGRLEVSALLQQVSVFEDGFAGKGRRPTREAIQTLEGELDTTISRFAADGFRLRRDAEALVRETQVEIGLAMFGALFGAVFITLMLRRAVVPPIERAVAIASSIAEGQLDNDIDRNGTAETGRLMRALSTMQASIAEKIDRIERLRAQQASGYIAEIAVQYTRFETALDHMTMGLCMFDADGKLVVRNRRFLEMFGADDLPACLTRRKQTVRREALQASDTDKDYSCILEDGRTIAVSEEAMAGGGRVLLYDDVTEQRKAEARLTHMVRHDALTGLPNRFFFRELLQDLTDVRGTDRLAVLCLDLDHFKTVNDTLGHPVGDALLREVAVRLAGTAGGGETVVRLGGDEFAVISSGPHGARDAAVLAALLIDAFQTPFVIDEHTVSIGVSIGIAFAEAGTETHDIVLKRADLALYDAKAEGRGTFRLFEPPMEDRIQLRRQMEIDLRSAIEREAFELHYQPIVDARTGAINSFEALLRWPQPSGGFIPPSDFIPVAEEAGLIVAIGRWVLREACREATNWPSDIKVAVNLSPLQFRSLDLLADVKMALDVSGLEPNRLEVEITESLMLQNTQLTFSLLHSLHDLGIQISMDDFGTGYSSLGYLRLFPFDKIKIDQSFVRDLVESGDGFSIVKSVIQLGRSLQMKVVAEGVETSEQISLLTIAGCQELQGYGLGRPQHPDALPELIAGYAKRVAPASADVEWQIAI